MKAKITFNTTTYGCQKEKETDRMIDWVSGGNGELIVDFEPSEKYSNTIMALKAMPKPYSAGNCYTIHSGFKVEILKEEAVKS